MFNIIDYRTAQRIKPALEFAMKNFSKIMENPEEFITKGYWNIPDIPPIMEGYEQEEALYQTFTDAEDASYDMWLKAWLNAYGWDISEDLERIIPYRTATNNTPAPTGENQ